jgi:hypothetical protein
MFTELIRGYAIQNVSKEAENLCKEYKGKFETNKPKIISALKDYAHETVKIELEEVLVWDDESISIKFGKLLP